jgi:hypothetical protein
VCELGEVLITSSWPSCDNRLDVCLVYNQTGVYPSLDLVVVSAYTTYWKIVRHIITTGAHAERSP